MATANGDLDIHLSDSCAPLRPVQWQTGLNLDNHRLIRRHPDHQASQALPWPYNDATFTKHERDPYDDWDEDD